MELRFFLFWLVLLSVTLSACGTDHHSKSAPAVPAESKVNQGSRSPLFTVAFGLDSVEEVEGFALENVIVYEAGTQRNLSGLIRFKVNRLGSRVIVLEASEAASEVRTGYYRIVAKFGGKSLSINVLLPAPGDANRDGQIDYYDYETVIRAGKIGAAGGAQWEDGDFDRDGRVTTKDLQILQEALSVADGPYSTDVSESGS